MKRIIFTVLIIVAVALVISAVANGSPKPVTHPTTTHANSSNTSKLPTPPVGLSKTSQPTSGPSTVASATTAAKVSKPPKPAAPTLLFSDDFDTLDLNKWVICAPPNPCAKTTNNSLHCYMSNNVSVNNGILYLTAKQEQATCPDGVTYNYTSGMIVSATKFDFRYGYMEARAKTPIGVGFWPSIWTLPTDYSWPPELDMLEQVGGVPGCNYQSVHWGANNDDHYVQNPYCGADYTADFHTYGMNWQPGRVDFYMDGQLSFSYTIADNVPTVPMYILINLAVGGTSGPPPNADTVFPSSLQVDYIKVWSNKP